MTDTLLGNLATGRYALVASKEAWLTQKVSIYFVAECREAHETLDAVRLATATVDGRRRPTQRDAV